MPTKYYLLNSNTDTGCDQGAGTSDHDMTKTAPGGATSHTEDVSGVTSYTFLRSYQINVAGDSPITGSQTYNLSIDITTLTKADVRFRIAGIDDATCLTTNFSGYQEFLAATGAGIQTFSLTLNFTAGDEDLVLEMEAREESGAHGTRQVTISVDDNDSWVEAPWPVAAAGGPRSILHG